MKIRILMQHSRWWVKSPESGSRSEREMHVYVASRVHRLMINTHLFLWENKHFSFPTFVCSTSSELYVYIFMLYSRHKGVPCSEFIATLTVCTILQYSSTSVWISCNTPSKVEVIPYLQPGTVRDHSICFHEHVIWKKKKSCPFKQNIHTHTHTHTLTFLPEDIGHKLHLQT